MRFDFKQSGALLAAALTLTLAAGEAAARPPTATVSPGYDRALAESRRAREQALVAGQEAPAAPKPRARRPRR
jgi:hypothetical protein